MTFTVRKVYREERFSLGVEADGDVPYLSFPVQNRLVDYEEYYEVPRAWVDAPDEHAADIRTFLAGARARRHDDKLLVQPGTDRGFAG